MSETSENLPKVIVALAQEFRDLEKRAVSVYEPIVNSILAGRSTDVGHIEQTLDGLLGLASSVRALLLRAATLNASRRRLRRATGTTANRIAPATRPELRYHTSRFVLSRPTWNNVGCWTTNYTTGEFQPCH